MSAQPGPIPEAWRKAVVRILQQGTLGKHIQIPRRTEKDWQADSLGKYLFELRDALIGALSPGAIGKLNPEQPEPGTTYAFWMHVPCGNQCRKFYAKVCLHRGNVTIKVLSAHLPDKGDQL